uniref:Uncharacterized protein n=1 Tax=Hippocampus comes TaxID=109280 RepID=A0A3Q3DAM6_HIPCM
MLNELFHNAKPIVRYNEIGDTDTVISQIKLHLNILWPLRITLQKHFFPIIYYLYVNLILSHEEGDLDQAAVRRQRWRSKSRSANIQANRDLGQVKVFISRATPDPSLSPPTTLIGDYIVGNIHFFNAGTHCFPGTTVPDILDKLPCMLQALPSSIQRVVETNYTDLQQSKLTNGDFKCLLYFLDSCGKSVFISGPLPTHGRGSGHFRILSLHTWLQFTCRSDNVVFIDNFNLFRHRLSFFKKDDIHPNKIR